MTDKAFGYIESGDIAIREAADGDGRTIEGYAYRWGMRTGAGDTREAGPSLAEGFDPGAFSPAIAMRGDRNWPYLDRHDGTVIGAVRFAEDDKGLRYEGRLLDTQAARDYAASVPAGNDGVSLEFQYRGATSRRERGAIIHTAVPRIGALAGTYKPAYDGAMIALREVTVDEPMDTAQAPEPKPDIAVVSVTKEQAAGIARDAALELIREYAERGSFTGNGIVDPLAGYGSLGELMAASFAVDDGAPGGKVPPKDSLRRYAARALADVVFTAGANAGLASGNLITQDIKGLIARARPAIAAFGGPRGLGDSAGLTAEWAYFDGTLTDFVAAQSAEKAEIESATVDIKLATEALKTYAGGADISYQVLRRGSPSILDAFGRIALAAYAVVTDAAFVTELETGSVTIDFAEALAAHDLTEFTGNLVDASIAVQAATGSPAQFALLSSTAFAQYAKAAAAASTATVVSPDFTIAGLNLNVGGIRLILDANVTAGKAIVSNDLAAAWLEDGPFQVSAEDVAHLGRDVAYWGLGAGARFIPAGIIEVYDVTP